MSRWKNAAVVLAGMSLAMTASTVSDAAGVELVRGGKVVAAMVLPEQPLPVESYAAKELQYHIERSTGAQLQVVAESQLVSVTSHIYLGHCRAADAVKLDPTPLPGNGYLIKTVGHDLFICGKDSR